MKHLLLSVCAVGLALASAVSAQDEYTARLEPKSRVIAAGEDVTLVLSLDIRKDVAVPAALLTGLKLEVKVGEKAGARIEEAASGTVQLAAGTRIQRTVVVPGARLALPPAQELLDVTITWSGVPGAVAVVKVAPDSSKINIADLDLTKTKVLLITSEGQMTVRFLPDKAPKTVENFVKLSKDGFYNGTKFHRIMKGFMIQGGCPNTKAGAQGEPGTGSPGYMLKGEFNDTPHVRGVLSMARSQHPDSAGCQFFVCHGAAPFLNPVPGVPGKEGYTAFGVLDAGFDVLDQIANTRVKPSQSGEPSVPIEPVHLYSAIVLPVLKGK